MKGIISNTTRWFSRWNASKKKQNKTFVDSDYLNQKILVVADSPTQVYATKKVLKESGFSVITAENGKIGILKARDEKPDLIIFK